MPALTLRNMHRAARKAVRDVKHRGLGLPWMDVEPRDCFLASWPRSGNTWLRHILYFYVTGRDTLDMATLDAFAPIIDGIDLKTHLAAMGDAERRYIKTHELAAPYLTRGRIVYLVRDGRDAMLSYHKYRMAFNNAPADFDLFLTNCLADRYRYHSWHRNVASWLALRDDPAMLLLRFEDMRADPRAAFLRVLGHLGLPADADRVDRAVALATPERVNATFRTEIRARRAAGDGAGQGGLVERWRETYSEDQQRRFEAKAGEVLRALGYTTLYG